jgi:hypothetical protein
VRSSGSCGTETAVFSIAWYSKRPPGSDQNVAVGVSRQLFKFPRHGQQPWAVTVGLHARLGSDTVLAEAGAV